jgi:putative membrane protein
MRTAYLLIAAIVLAGCWLGPLPRAAEHSFTAHMMLHTAVVAVAAPFVALGIARTAVDPVRTIARIVAPIPASMIELVIVWTWHAPALHRAARVEPALFVLEQASFLFGGVWLWIAAVGGTNEQRRRRAGAGVAALLFTSMHMTLLGALFALADRPLFGHAMPEVAASPVSDQQTGGVIMLLVGGSAYLIGALWLTRLALDPRSHAACPVEEQAT